ncbi:MAG TPA: FAD binding domain-containing protein [Xanthobacteraceae bacterium]|nr:FAD binding domain-containing protein [Xanthobacteraceae bacterium]
MHRFALATPKTVAEAATVASATVAHAMTSTPDLAGQNDVSVIKAGGIDLLDLLKEGLLGPSQVINLRDVPGLDTVVEEEDGGLRIGPMVTLASLSVDPHVRQRYPALAAALGSSASPQIRNVATLGGNLLQRPRCWYLRSHAFRCLRKGGGHCFAIHGENQYHAIFNNMPCAIVHPSTAATVLVALGATVEITGAGGATRRLLLENFFVSVEQDMQRENSLEPHEILAAIRLPHLPPGVRMAHIKQGEKDSFDWPLADVAAVLDLDASGVCQRAAIVLGAAAPVPHRAKTAEAALVGQRIDQAIAARAAHAALDGATPLSKNAYKVPLFEALVRRTIIQAVS